MDHFGRAGTPAFQFTLRLRFGYYVTVAVWENRPTLKVAVGRTRLRGSILHGYFVADVEPKRRKLGTVHLAIPSLDDGTLVHECVHVVVFWAQRVRSRFHDLDALDEAVAQEIESSFLTMRSHALQEKRRLES